MVASPKTMDALRTIGLNKYERNLWAALLSRGSSTVGELSDVSNVPRSRCYDVLESLSERGFVVIQPGKPMKYVAIPPREALERVKKKAYEEAVEMNEKIDRLVKSDTIKELEKLHKENIKTIRPKDLTGAIKGRHAMHQQLELMFKKAKKSIKLMTTPDGLEELMENHEPFLKKAYESGVKIQVLAPVSKQTDTVKNVTKYAQVRSVENAEKLEKMLGRLFVVDGEEFLLGLTDDTKTHPTQDISFWTQSSHVTTNMLEPMFEMLWARSRPVK